MEAQTTVSNLTQCGLFSGEYKKYTLSGVTFSFKRINSEELTTYIQQAFLVFMVIISADIKHYFLFKIYTASCVIVVLACTRLPDSREDVNIRQETQN